MINDRSDRLSRSLLHRCDFLVAKTAIFLQDSREPIGSNLVHICNYVTHFLHPKLEETSLHSPCFPAWTKILSHKARVEDPLAVMENLVCKHAHRALKRRRPFDRLSESSCS